MSRLDWSTIGSRFYEAGVDRGVLYVDGQPAVVWTGLASVDENPSGGEPRSYYIDGVKYANVSSSEEFQATITAYTYPDAFGQCDGTAQIRPGMFVKNQSRKSFGLSYRTKVGNDIDGLDHAYKIHLIYNALVSPSSQTYNTIDDSLDPTTFSWSLTTKPQAIADHSPSAHIVIDSRYTLPEALLAIENALYGSDSNIPSLLSYSDLLNIFDSFGDLVVVDNGDGTFTISAPNTVLHVIDGNTFDITADSIVIIDEGTYTISS